MPIIAMLIGKSDFSDLTFTINDAVFRYGAFITSVIQFLAIGAAVFFFVVKPVQMMAARGKEPIEEGMPTTSADTGSCSPLCARAPSDGRGGRAATAALPHVG